MYKISNDIYNSINSTVNVKEVSCDTTSCIALKNSGLLISKKNNPLNIHKQTNI